MLCLLRVFRLSKVTPPTVAQHLSSRHFFFLWLFSPCPTLFGCGPQHFNSSFVLLKAIRTSAKHLLIPVLCHVATAPHS